MIKGNFLDAVIYAEWAVLAGLQWWLSIMMMNALDDHAIWHGLSRVPLAFGGVILLFTGIATLVVGMINPYFPQKFPTEDSNEDIAE